MSTANSQAQPSPPAEAPPVQVDARLATLTAAVEALQGRVQALEARMAGLPAIEGADPLLTANQISPEEEVQLPALSQILGLLGRACLILGGAYFIRAFTDAGQLPRLPGALFGLAYAGLWGLLGQRTARPLNASGYTLVAAMIAYPLLWEATTTFRVFSPPLAACLHAATTALLMVVAWRRSLHGTAWCITLAAMGSGLALASVTHALEAFALVFLAYGGGSLWLTYGRRWHGLRWPVALGTNGLIALLAIFLSWSGGPPEAYKALSPARGVALCLGLVGIYLGSFAGRMVQRFRPVNAFEIVQTLAVLLIGFGGAVRIASTLHTGLAALGGAILVAGAACYGVAFHFVEDRSQVQANFLFFTTLALAFVLSGGFLLLSWKPLSLALATLGLLFVLMGLRFDRSTLGFHAIAYLAAGTLTSTLMGQVQRAFLSTGTAPMEAPEGVGLFTTAILASAHFLLVARRSPDGMPWHLRLPSFVCAALALAGLGGTAVWLSCRWLGQGALEAGNLAAVRTAVLALSIIALAYLGRRFPASEGSWLVYPLLALTALKLLLEDLPAGRPLTLFVAFSLFGIALILAPRLLRPESSPPPS